MNHRIVRVTIICGFMLTFSKLTELFLTDKTKFSEAGMLSAKTVSWYRSGLVPLVKELGDVPAASVVAYQITAIRFQPNTMMTCRCLFRWAVKQRLIPVSPLVDVPLPRYEDRTRVPTSVEFRQIRRKMPPRYRMLLWVMRRCGARPGELRNARWGDFNAFDRTITLDEFKAKNRRKDKLKKRLLYLDVKTVRVLSWVQRCRSASESEYMFPGPGGRLMLKDSLCREFRRATKKLGFNVGRKDRLVCYSIRHGMATSAAAKGVPIRDLSEMMGHTTIAMTQRYLHPSRESLRQAIDLANRKPRRDEIAARPILGAIEGFPRLHKIA